MTSVVYQEESGPLVQEENYSRQKSSSVLKATRSGKVNAGAPQKSLK